jgi:zinc transport system permease protein
MELAAWTTFWEARALFADAMLAAGAAGCALGLMGVYIVLRRMVFLSAALGQAASLGVTLGFAAQAALEPVYGPWAGLCVPLGPLLATVAATAAVWWRSDRSDAPPDALLGAVYLVGAAGTLMVASRITAELHDVHSVLLGSAVAVLPVQARMLAGLCAALTVAHLGVRWGMVEALFDADGARVRGIPVALLRGGLLAGLAAVTSLGTQALGALPVFAFSVLPALAALGWARSMPVALVVAAGVGGLSGILGYGVAYIWALPVGAAQAAVAAACAGVGQLLGRLRR